MEIFATLLAQQPGIIILGACAFVIGFNVASILLGFREVKKEFRVHEHEDERRHQENLGRFATIEADIKKLFWGRLQS